MSQNTTDQFFKSTVLGHQIATFKYGIGMLFLGLGMACVAIGANGIEPGAKTASVSIIWLILVYLFLYNG